MPKRPASHSEQTITLERHTATPLYRQLYERLRAQILTGQLEPGARLPSTRAFASELGVSRTTMAFVYEQLLLEGYIESRVGSGTKVTALAPQRLAKGSQRPHARHATRTPDTTAAGDSPDASLIPARLSPASASPFRVGYPDVAAFPYDIWSRLVARHSRQSLPDLALDQSPLGYYPLREAIAAHIGITRGVRCSPERIIITAGAQGAFDLLARVLLAPGAAAWVEEPGYPNARGALLAAGATLIPTPVDQRGLVVAAGHDHAPNARLAVVTPSHQFPTGSVLSLSRRLELLEWARAAPAWIVEDDYDSEFRFSGRPLEALHGLDSAERVVYVGTFSKTLLPALRLGYLVAPPAVCDALVAARRFIDGRPPQLEQLALTDFLRQGHFVRHLKRMRARYQERRDALLEALQQELGGLLEIGVPEAGMSLAAWLPDGMSDQAVARRAAERGLNVTPISTFCLEPIQRGGLLFGFASASPDTLRAGVQSLSQVLRSL
jgi:GntR family transcriptional regulator/MocR family aminotransferase